MATLEEGLISYLLSCPGLTALVGTRIYGLRKPQNTALPCLTVQRISTAREQTHDTSGASDLASPRFQFDAWAELYETAKPIVDELRAVLNGKRGTIGVGANQVTIQNALVDNEVPEIEPEMNLFRARSDYIIWHVE